MEVESEFESLNIPTLRSVLRANMKCGTLDEGGKKKVLIERLHLHFETCNECDKKSRCETYPLEVQEIATSALKVWYPPS